ncbi:hypothetical protein ABIB35_001503 [Arthrobacter sp. UYP6]
MMAFAMGLAGFLISYLSGQAVLNAMQHRNQSTVWKTPGSPPPPPHRPGPVRRVWK